LIKFFLFNLKKMMDIRKKKKKKVRVERQRK